MIIIISSRSSSSGDGGGSNIIICLKVHKHTRAAQVYSPTLYIWRIRSYAVL